MSLFLSLSISLSLDAFPHRVVAPLCSKAWDPFENGNNWRQLIKRRATDRALTASTKVTKGVQRFLERSMGNYLSGVAHKTNQSINDMFGTARKNLLIPTHGPTKATPRYRAIETPLIPEPSESRVGPSPKPFFFHLERVAPAGCRPD